MIIKFLLVVALLAIAAPSFAQSAGAGPTGLPFLSPLFSDNMVLQRDHIDAVWGWTTPGARVSVAFAGKTSVATAGADGKWSVLVGPIPAGGPYTMDITGPSTVHLSNILMGDVWVCSGQSNMEVSVAMAKDAKAEIAAADHPNIRLFLVHRAWGADPQKTLYHGETWKVCTPETITQGGWNGFSAVAYFFGRDLETQTHVPIGLIQSCWSGTFAEAWVSAPALSAMSGFTDVTQRLDSLNALGPRIAQAHLDWCDKYDARDDADSSPSFNDSHWQTIALPAQWSQFQPLRGYTGVVWLRRSVTLTSADIARDVVLHLGPVADSDTVWVNGTQVGFGTGRGVARTYAVPTNALRSGENEIAIRVLNLEEGVGGLGGNPQALRLDTGGGRSVALAGPWRYHPALRLDQVPNDQPVWDEDDQASRVPAALYNDMIAPLVPYGIAGVIWYQGESNTPRAGEYEGLLTNLITDWRHNWGEGDFPFYIVQLSSLDDWDPTRRGHWAALREAQAEVARSVANSGLAVTVDIGSLKNIHPIDKQDVGYRLSLLALDAYYHKSLDDSGPVYSSMERMGDMVRVTFDHADGGLVSHGRSLAGFEIAGADQKFVPARATITGNVVVVSSPDVKDPVAVRYAWADYPQCSLYNGAGLPAVPFRTDNW